MKKQKVPVTEHALIQRINRRLAEKDELLKKTRARYVEGRPYWDQNLGEFYIVDLRSNFLVAAHLGLEELGREMGALRAYETLEGRA